MKSLTTIVASLAIASGLFTGVITTALGNAHADVDTDFTNELNSYGIYAQKDFNAWLGKIACKRLNRGVDSDAKASVHFLKTNFRNLSEVQAWQFLGTAINTYCPEQANIYQQPSSE